MPTPSLRKIPVRQRSLLVWSVFKDSLRFSSFRAHQRFHEDLAEVRTVLMRKLAFVRNSKEWIFQYNKEK